jgi:O-antigen ligase
LTTLLWLFLFGLFVAKGLSRPVWMLSAYLMTFFASPAFWWWGKTSLMSITTNWNLGAAILLAITTLMNWRGRIALDYSAQLAFGLLAAFTVNVACVHYLFADNAVHSVTYYGLAWKQAVLVYVVYHAVRTRDDLRLFLISLFAGCVYIGFEVVFRSAGGLQNGRLEGVYLPGAGDTNGLSGALSLGLPIAAYLFLSNKTSVVGRIGVGFGSVLILETLLRCNSRGAYLAAIAATFWLLVATRGPVRKRMFALSGLGIVAVLLQAKNTAIWERFFTTFASAEQRDGSANERIEYWKAAWNMIVDHPFGSGGEAAFNSDIGFAYITHIRDFEGYRSVHNGYLDIAAGWGIQGLALFLASLAVAFYAAFKSQRYQARGQVDDDGVILGAAVQAVLVSQLVVALFISSLDNEWFYWCLVLLATYARLYQAESVQLATSRLNEAVQSQRSKGTQSA